MMATGSETAACGIHSGELRTKREKSDRSVMDGLIAVGRIGAEYMEASPMSTSVPSHSGSNTLRFQT